MNYNDNDDELERMRARSTRGPRRSTGRPNPSAGRSNPSVGRSGLSSARPASPDRSAAGAGLRDNYDDEYYFDEEFGEEEYGGRNRRQVDFDVTNSRGGYENDEYGYLDDEFYDASEGRTGNSRTGNSRNGNNRTGNTRAGGQAGAASKAHSAHTGRRPSGSPSSKTQKQSRKTSQSSKSGQRTRYQDEDDFYADSNGRNRDASRRPGQGQMAKRRKKKSWKGILLILLAAVIGYGAWLFLHRPTGIWNVAVFGVDSRDGNTKNALADVQMICSINRSTGEIKLVSVYRDTYLKINSEGTYHKINEAYFKGGQKQAVAALEENLDLKIDDYATFNWKSVAEAINILGGVDIDITDAEFKYINGFITETVNSTGIGSVQLSAPGPNHLDGVQAVAYSRLRLMDTDFQRTERQRKVVMLALEKAKQADVSTLTSLATYLIPQISTSVGPDDVLPLVKDINKYHIGETAGFPFSRQTKRVGKMDCVIPTTLESNVVLLHKFLYGEETSYSPSSAVKKISAHISEETGLYEEDKAAPSGGSSGGSSGGQTPAQTAPAQTPAPETTAPEESTQESVEETTQEETEPTEEETEETQEIGPGITKPHQEPDRDNEETKESDKGPGAGEHTKPAEKPTSAPTTEAPDTPGPGTGGPGSAPSDPGTTGPGEAGPGV